MLEMIIKRYKYKLLIWAATGLFLPMTGLILFVVLLASFVGGNEMAIIRAIEIPGEYLILAKAKADETESDFIQLLAASTALVQGDVEKYNEETLEEAYLNIDNPIETPELYDIYKKSYGEIKTGPVPKSGISRTRVYVLNPDTGEKEWQELETYKDFTYSHYDDFGAARTYGGDRSHEGNDVVAQKGTPLVSMTDGTIVSMGWNDFGGWQISIMDANGTYWYYAHMERYALDLEIDQYITAGTLIGYVGSSGYGPVGTTGKFIDHLHLQIGIKLDPAQEEYTWINPYPIIVYTDPMRQELNQNEER